MTTQLGFTGLPPTVSIQNKEQRKYEEVWKHAKYREAAPGEGFALQFCRHLAKPQAGETIVDFGCGTGRGGLALACFSKAKVRLLDFAPNCLDKEVLDYIRDFPERLSFGLCDLTQPIAEEAKYGYCTDVMEHVPENEVDLVLANILKAARNVFFQISLIEDNLGVLIGEKLHLTVKPFAWWLERFRNLKCAVMWSKDLKNYGLFYVARYATAKDIHDKAGVNISPEETKANVLENLKGGYREVSPHDSQNTEVMLVCGGPSLNGFVEDIREKRKAGMPLVTVNGAYNWCLERDIRPSAQIVLDGREFNKRFVSPPIEGCRYLLASQCHPETLRAVPKEQVWMWHCGASDPVREALEESGQAREWYPIFGGMTVMLRAFPLLRTLGFQRFHVYGFDSCHLETHHAYEQKENDGEPVTTVTVGGREFKCSLWMASQAHEFIDIQKMIADVVEMEVYGDGLIAHIIKTGHKLSQEK